MDFSRPGEGTKLGQADKEQVMESLKTQYALANVQELLQKMSDKCFHKCVTRPGTSLDSSEQKCVSMCMDRYMDAWNLVSRTYGNRLRKESGRF